MVWEHGNAEKYIENQGLGRDSECLRHINTEYILIMSRKYKLQKHLAVAVLYIIRHWHT